ncbi:MAG TPA: hypothetical protein VHD55_03805 [Candidatus Paceibacterota bacterium]|nr:hypothetical protein [Candidatus Paceibacterota bacterium]
MINPQLLDYVRAQRASGLSKEAITQALAQGGWTQQDVAEAFMAIDGVQTPPPPPPPPATPGPVAPRVITPPMQPNPNVPPLQPMGGQFGSPTAPAMQPRPVMAASELSTARVAAKKGHGLLYMLLILLVVLIAGLGALFYFQPNLVLGMLGLSMPEPTPVYEPAPVEPAPIDIVPTPDVSTTTAATTTASTTAQ